MAKIANPLAGYKLGDAFGNRKPIPGVTKTSFHGGRDIPAPAGSAIRAGGSGTVVSVQTGWYRSGSNHYVSRVLGRPIHNAESGNVIGIQYDGGFVITYAHALSIPGFAIGDRVTPETIIAYVGTTGTSTGPHLHMTAFLSLADAYAWKRVNPDDLIDYNLRASNAGSGNVPAPTDTSEEYTMADIQTIKNHIEHVGNTQGAATRAHVSAEADRVIKDLTTVISAEGGRVKAHIEHVARTVKHKV